MSYIRWMPSGSQERSASLLRLLNYRLRRLEAQSVDDVQPLNASTPVNTEYQWHQTGDTIGAGYWVVGPPPTVTINFTIPTDESWAYIAFGGEALRVSPHSSLWGMRAGEEPKLLFRVDGAAIAHDPGQDEMHLYHRQNKDWTQGHRSYSPSIPARLYALDLEPGAHTVTITTASPDFSGWYVADTRWYVRNLWLRGYVQA